MSESVLVPGVNQENARALLASADRLGLDPSVVQVSSLGGFLVPQEVFDGLGDAEGEDFEVQPIGSRLQGLDPDDPGADAVNPLPGSVEKGPGDLDGPDGPGLVDLNATPDELDGHSDKVSAEDFEGEDGQAQAQRAANERGWIQGEGGEESDTEPPRSGKGSGVEAWRAYAGRKGVTVEENATRDEIIAAVDAKQEETD